MVKLPVFTQVVLPRLAQELMPPAIALIVNIPGRKVYLTPQSLKKQTSIICFQRTIMPIANEQTMRSVR